MLTLFAVVGGLVVIAATYIERAVRKRAATREAGSPDAPPPRDPYRNPPSVEDGPSSPTPLKKPLDQRPFAFTTAKNGRRRFTCPKCGQVWHYEKIASPTYCTCSDALVGHFHMDCDGDKNEPGCGYKWIMLERPEDKALKDGDG